MKDASEQVFHPTLDAAIEYALENGQADVTREQAIEYAQRFELTDATNDSRKRHELMREIQDDDCNDTDEIHFTNILQYDIDETGESLEDFFNGWNIYQVWNAWS